MSDDDPELKRFDEAIENLLNGRWVDQEAIQTVFAYQDGKISRAKMREKLA